MSRSAIDGRWAVGFVGIVVLTCAASAPSSAWAVDASAGSGMGLQMSFGLSAVKSDWRGDAGAGTSLKLGFLPSEYVSMYFLGRLSAATVDERMLTFVSLGAQYWPMGQRVSWRPYGRLALAHQHEETLGVVADDPIGAIFGIGDGIRHRGGLEGAVGLELPLFRDGGLEAFAALESAVTWFYDPRGPTWYAGAGASIGVTYDL
jgi:hypothetical protein